MSAERTTIPRTCSRAEVEAQQATDRRHFLGAAGAAGIAIAAGALAGLGASGTASAVTGDPFVLGTDNSAPNTTLLNGGTTLYVEDGGSMDNATVSVHQSNEEAVAIHAESNGAFGIAVNAYNSSADGIAISAANSGARGRAIRADNLEGGTAAILATNNVEDRIAVDATNWAVGGTAVNAVSSEDGTGLYASSTNGRAVYAQSSGSQETVLATSLMSAAVVAKGGTFDVVASGSGKVLLAGINVSNPPGAVATAGVLTRDNDNNVWASVAGDSWRKLAGPATAGSLHLLAAPVRTYDSRPSESPATGPKTPLSGTRTINVTLNGTGIPSNATAIVANVTARWQTATGFLSVTPGGAGFTGTSNANSSGVGGRTSAPVTVAAGPGATIDLHVGGGGTADVIVDVSGYYR